MAIGRHEHAGDLYLNIWPPLAVHMLSTNAMKSECINVFSSPSLILMRGDFCIVMSLEFVAESAKNSKLPWQSIAPLSTSASMISTGGSGPMVTVKSNERLGF